MLCLNLALEKEAALNAVHDEEHSLEELYDEPQNLPTADESLYSEPESHRRELPPIPDDYHHRGPSETNRASGRITDNPQSDSWIFSNIGPSRASSYSWLSSSTREPPPLPAVYDELTKSDYYNINGPIRHVK